MRTRPQVAALLVAAVLSGVPGAHGQATKSGTPSAMSAFSRDLERLAARVTPAVVQIAATAYRPGESGARVTEGLIGRERRGGSGVILTADGYILTNAHVVAGASRLRVMVAISGPTDSPRRSLLQPAGRWVEGRVVGLDRETDLAVLKVEENGLPHLSLGDSERLKPGQVVLAFGSPLGLENSVTMGVVSAVARQLEPESRMVYLQTDTPINPGNSGGPLVNLDGEVVGINTLIFSQSGGSEGIGFAAPANIARNVFEQIRAHGRVRRGEIGVNAQTITPTLGAALGLPRDWGVIFADVYPGGPAEGAGLEPGDVVRSLDGKVMENGRQLDVNLYRRAVGDVVTLEVERGGRSRTVRVTVVERAEDAAQFQHLVHPERNLVRRLGILGLDLTPDLATRLPWLRRRAGVLVGARAADAPYAGDGLEPGDVIVAVNRVSVETLAVLRSTLDRLVPGAAVVLRVDRRGRYLYIPFEIE